MSETGNETELRVVKHTKRQDTKETRVFLRQLSLSLSLSRPRESCTRRARALARESHRGARFLFFYLFFEREKKGALALSGGVLFSLEIREYTRAFPSFSPKHFSRHGSRGVAVFMYESDSLRFLFIE